MTMRELSNPSIQELKLGDFKEEAKVARRIYDVLRDNHNKPHNYNEFVIKTLTHHVLLEQPIPIRGFWGIGERDHINAHDKRFLDNLQELNSKIAEVYVHGSSMQVILADLHGVFNGHVDEKAIQVFPEPHIPYLNKIQRQLHQRGIRTVWLSNLYKRYNMQIPDVYEPIDETSDEYNIFMEQEQRRHELYVNSARQHGRRDVPPEQLAYHYIRERVAEKPMLVDAFKDALFFVNGGRNLAVRLIPEDKLPIVYLNEGPVWFMEGGEQL